MRCLGRHKFAFRGGNKGLPWDIYHPKPGLDGNEMYEMIYTTILHHILVLARLHTGKMTQKFSANGPEKLHP